MGPAWLPGVPIGAINAQHPPPRHLPDIQKISLFPISGKLVWANRASDLIKQPEDDRIAPMLHRLFSSSQRGMPTMPNPQSQRCKSGKGRGRRSPGAIPDIGKI